MVLSTSSLMAQAPDTLWTRTFGGSGTDEIRNGIITSNGELIFAGETNSFGSGSIDAWLIKTNSSGDSLWSHTYGGDSSDHIFSVDQTNDGGFILAGYTWSFGAGASDYWIIKTDSIGDTLWTKTFGGISSDEANDVSASSDGGFVVTGSANLSGSHSWTIKFASNGDTLWSHRVNGVFEPQSVIQTSDGGYIIAGNAIGVAGSFDFWVLKMNANGITQWSKTYGGADLERANSIIQLSDGGFVIAGLAQYTNLNDFLVLRTDSNGDSLWMKTYGGSGFEKALDVNETIDGNLIVLGTIKSPSMTIPATWLIKINLDGDTLWQKIIDIGTGEELLLSMDLSACNEIFLFGQLNLGNWDAWLVKLDSDISPSGDVDSNGVIQAFDASQILKYLSGQIDLTKWKQFQSDVSDNCDISSFDASLILRHVVGAITLFPSQQDSFPPDSASGILALDEPIQSNGNEIVIPIYGADISKLYSGSISLNHDSSVLEFQEVRTLDATDGFIVSSKALNSEITIYFAGAHEIEGDAVLFEVVYSRLSNISTNVILTSVSMNDNLFLTDRDTAIVEVAVNVEDEKLIPKDFELFQNYPNPFNPITVIKYGLPKSSNISLVIYNVMGQEIMRWEEQNAQPGYHEQTWGSTNQYGEQVATGIYLYRILAGDFVQTRKMVLLK